MNTIHIYSNGRLEEKQSGIVREFPLVLHVNGREIATLIASPHDLRFLVAGFLRNQGFVERAGDFHMLAVCDDFGIANVRIRNELPERLKPVLTSGCGTGVTFTLESDERVAKGTPEPSVSPDAVFRLMEELARRADNYKSHGGIHSAALGDGEGNLLLFAEDIGRHNTLDRIAGEALFKGIDLAGKILVTSGRVSTEMAAKCARLGISLVASRTSATDMAVKMCEEAGIALIGYVRGGKFTVYAHCERLAVDESRAGLRPAPTDDLTNGSPFVGAGLRPARSMPVHAQASHRIPGVTGVILAGGQSSRMGSNKALLPYKGGRFIEAIHRQLAEIFDEVLLVTNTPEQYDFLPCRKVADIHPGMGALAGIHAGLHHAANPAAFMVACDMPYLSSDLIRHMAAQADPGGVLIPESPQGLEPLHAVYGKGCLAAIETTLFSGERRIVSFFGRTNVNRVNAEQVSLFDPNFDTFSNINTPVDYYRLRDSEREEHAADLAVDRAAG